jgi:hypothetical protein
MWATVALAATDALLAGGLLVVYAKAYRRVRAPFTLGLIMFAGFFVAQNLLALYAYLTMMHFFPEALHVYMVAIMAFEALALAVMLHASNQ